ncbi:hypothetical protein [Tissierella sp.]|uniref:hypothetical protein n=1 Tax=Tissierella sp. TaxID=41274 RepID=UPI003065C068
MENNSVYIMSVEGAKVWEHAKGKNITEEYIGMLPKSLTLDKLIDSGMKIRIDKGKKWSRDVINVSFLQKFRSTNEILEKFDANKFAESVHILENNIANTKNQREIKQLQGKLDSKNKFIEYITLATEENWDGISAENLRIKFYEEGFTITYKDGEIIEYEVFKRSSSKSRTGRVLFINRKLNKDKLTRWSRLGMDLEGAIDVDYPSLLSYESLVDSSIEDKIEINVDNILLVSDVKSIFTEDVNLIKKNEETGLLESILNKDYQMESDIFDGEGLLDSRYFANGKGMMLLRQHMFKSCVFNTNIQQFLKDNCPSNIDYDKWKLKDMFGNIILAKDVHMITTPNSLKALKFSHKKKCDKVMYEHWKTKVRAEENLFGIVKYEEESQRGYDAGGNILNQTSYQMLGSMNFSKDDMGQLSKFEVDYIMKLKNDISTYIKYLDSNKNDMNSNEMWVDLYNHNHKIMYTKQFKDKRKQDIKSYVKSVRKGKLRLRGDYTTIIQNGKELLYHAIGKLPVVDGVLDYHAWRSEMELKGNECYTTQHEFGREYTAFRNPHTSMSNVLILYNKYSKFISKYFNFSKNIIYTNAINFAINRILSGQDVDSDSLVIFDNDIMLKVARNCYIHSSQYNVCENGVVPDTNTYTVNDADMAKIDNILANSQKYIGRVVNLGAIYLNKYWDMINNKKQDAELIEETLKAIDICTVLSEISIDMAKRFYAVDIDKQIDNLELDVAKPRFMKYTKTKAKNTKYYCSSMDYLQEILDCLDIATEIDTKDIISLLSKDINSKKVKNDKANNIVKLIKKMTERNNSIEGEYINKNGGDDLEEKYTKQAKNRDYYFNIISRFKIDRYTMHKIILDVFAGRIDCKYKTDLLNTLYKVDREEFIATFK